MVVCLSRAGDRELSVTAGRLVMEPCGCSAGIGEWFVISVGGGEAEEFWLDANGWPQPVTGRRDSPSGGGTSGGAVQEVMHRRPMPCLRTPRELVTSTAALLAGDDADPRVRFFRSGAVLALNWVHGLADQAPVSRAPIPLPCLLDAVQEYAAAAQLAATDDVQADRSRQAVGRLVARGCEAYLLWCCVPDTPTPALLDRNADRAAVVALLGDVGRHLAGLPEVDRGPVRFPLLPGSRYAADGSRISLDG